MSLACSLFSPMKELSLGIEGIPDCLTPVFKDKWTVLQASLSGDLCEIEMDWTAGLPDTFFIDSPKEEDLLLLLYPPLLVEGCRMNPLGVFIPSHEDRGEFCLVDGSAVSILITLVHNNLSIEDFNCSRFLLEMARLEDPWLVEEQTLLKQLGRREMRSWYIRTKTLFAVELPLPAGIWYGASLLQNVTESSGPEDINPVHIELPEGYSFLYCPVRQEVMEIQVDSHGDAVWITTYLP